MMMVITIDVDSDNNWDNQWWWWWYQLWRLLLQHISFTFGGSWMILKRFFEEALFLREAFPSTNVSFENIHILIVAEELFLEIWLIGMIFYGLGWGSSASLWSPVGWGLWLGDTAQVLQNMLVMLNEHCSYWKWSRSWWMYRWQL